MPDRYIGALGSCHLGRDGWGNDEVYFDRGTEEWGGKIYIEQFTGTLDKNVVEIYEGDIVKIEGEMIGHLFSPSESKTIPELARHSWTAKVIWDPGYAQFLFDYIGRPDYKGRGHFCGRAPWCEVIGNIHENPSLLNP